LEKSFVVPEGIVGIETDCLQISCHLCLTSRLPPFSLGGMGLYNPAGDVTEARQWHR
jgi:hypothetical protein